MGTSLEMYATDSSGHFPSSLDKLAPNYILAVRRCPKGEPAMRKKASPSLTDQLRGALKDIQEGSVRSRSAALSLPPARVFSSEDVRVARDSLNMTQSEFAELLQVSTKTVQAWEAGRRSPGPGQARWIDMFTGPEWRDQLRKSARHPRAPREVLATSAAPGPVEIETIGPRRRLGGHPRTDADPSEKAAPSAPKRAASARQTRSRTITERLE